MLQISTRFSSMGCVTAIIKFENTTPKNLNSLQFISCFSFFSLVVYGEGLIMFRTLHISARGAALYNRSTVFRSVVLAAMGKHPDTPAIFLLFPRYKTTHLVKLLIYDFLFFAASEIPNSS